MPYDVPRGWEWQKLGDIGTWQSGATPSRLNKDYYGGDIPWLKTGDLNDGFIYEIPETITQKALEETSVKLNPAGSVLIAMYGATIGKVGILSFPATTNQACCACVNYQGIEQMYLFYFLLSHKEEFLLLGGGGAQPNISKEKIVDTFIPIPPLLEQKRIVNAIEQWFNLIESLETVKEDLQMYIAQAKSKILDHAIHGKLVPQDPNDEPAIELLKRINPKFIPCDNAHDTNQLPKSWCWATLGNIFQHNTGKALNKSDSLEGTLKPYLTTSNVYWDSFDFTEVKQMYFKDSEIDKCTVQKGDLLVCEGGDIGRAAIWNYDHDICIQNHIHRLRAKGMIDHRLYLYVLMLYKWTDKIHGKGIGLQGLSSGLLDKLIIPVSPYNEQKRIVAKIEELFAVLDEIKESLEA
ncbi:MAG: restriction endonuclease subunit S [Bacteroidaceae bacterium]|nr:restriction endonuclease subunit S [Bacteroidaceae bacterium]